jgi:hypothetical protein
LTARIPHLPPVVHRAAARAMPFLLPTWFIIGSLTKLAYFWTEDLLAVDYWIYREAGAVALAGGDPWTAAYHGFRFAAPPPTVIPYAALSLLPELRGLALSFGVLLGAAVVTVRVLKLPWWWLAFPPLFESLLAQNPDVLIVALLVAPRWWGALAPMFKVYGGIPLVFQKRWKEAVLAGAICLISLPLVPGYLAQFGELSQVLEEQSSGGFSVWGTVFMLPTIVALFVLGRVRAGWMIVPAMWPSTQPHYSCLAIPVIKESRMFAAIVAVPIPGSAAVGCIYWAIVLTWRQRQEARAKARASTSPETSLSSR